MNEVLYNLIFLILKSTYFLIPAYLANMAPPLVKKIKLLEFLKIPVDHGKKFSDGKVLFGKNKTYRGFVVGAIGGIIGAYLQMFLFQFTLFQKVSISGIDYNNHIIVLLIGLLMGLGAITGDLIESFFKRRINVNPGESLKPWDQIDLVLGAYLFVLPITYLYLSWSVFLCSIIMTFFLHVLVNHIAFYLHIRNEKW
jgi:CDP-2,3-bis-(O-geranylgeranyl)-sn-glycerol synthase